MLNKDLNERNEMEINENMVRAARKSAQTFEGASHHEIPDYPGMFVGLASDATLVALMFFTEGGQRFAVGPLRSGA